MRRPVDHGVGFGSATRRTRQGHSAETASEGGLFDVVAQEDARSQWVQTALAGLASIPLYGVPVVLYAWSYERTAKQYGEDERGRT